ncbi:hypothetical protein V8B55DRAFT_1564823 [Mucor lusitanicus]
MFNITHQDHLFLEDIDNSEWDFVVKFWVVKFWVVKFWGVITEELFHGSGLRLKWGDTHLALHDTVTNLPLKVDMRILHDRRRQGFDVETNVGAMEAAEEDPGDAKYLSDRCKVLVESKAMIDKFLLDGCLIDTVDSLQFVYFGSISLAARGLYVGTQFYNGTISNSLNDLTTHLDLAFNLLCFRDQSRSSKSAAKRRHGQFPLDDLINKQQSVRGSWNLPRTTKTPPPPTPAKLFSNN